MMLVLDVLLIIFCNLLFRFCQHCVYCTI